MTVASPMRIDYTDDAIRQQLIDELRPFILDYVDNQLSELNDQSLVGHAHTVAFREIIRYIDDKLVIEFKDD